MPRCTAVHFKAPMVLLTLLLAGCSALSPYSNVTKLDLTLSASDQVNPDVHGRASPVVIRLLELKHFSDLPALLARPGETVAATVFAVGNIVGSGQERASSSSPHSTPDVR